MRHGARAWCAAGALALAAAGLTAARPSSAQVPPPGGEQLGRPRPGPGPLHSIPKGLPPGHPAAGPVAVHGAPEGEAAHEGGEHEQGVNWAYGMISEREGLTEPNLLFRPKGMPAPFLASVINFAILIGLALRFGRKPVAAGLVRRRDDLMRAIDEAARVKHEAAERLASYKKQTDQMQDDVGRIRADSGAQAERERERIVREAEEKRERMRRDAALLLDQERKHARQTLLARVSELASSRAEELLRTRTGPADHDRLGDEYLKAVAASGVGRRGVA